MLLPRLWRIVMVIAVATATTSCSLLQKNQAGMTPDNPILLDTMDLTFSVPEPELPLRGAEPKLTDVIHTELDLRFDLADRAVLGKARIRVRPYADPLDTIVLDARGFTFEKVGVMRSDSVLELEYLYDQDAIAFILDTTLAVGKEATLVLHYTAYPAELAKGSGQAIRSSQGLYFINPDGDSDRVHPQVWSQGETEYNSGWFPCIDQPNEKHTQEIMLTVDTSFVTLSNGRFVYSVDNGDGTKTDVWKQELPHSTYLTMIAFGDFAVVKDSWRDKDVWYYVDPEFEEHAMKIFGNTPEMLEFYSELLGYDYPWEKFHQVIVHDFVSGAMENTSAVVHGEFVQQTPREMIDGTHEDVIAHELFHHWFGDVVTSESWTQITMNEGFASYGEYLWWDHKYGAEEARVHLQSDLDAYLSESARGKNVPLIRRHYGTADEVFDRHSYQKGSRTIHMLRKEVGDEHFFNGLTRYLKANEFDNVEDVHLRLAMEEETGRDLFWFFDQWFHREGHPIVEVTYDVDTAFNNLIVSIQQDDRFGTYRFHVDLIAGNSEKQESRRLWIDEANESFEIELGFVPTWYAIDPMGDMLWEVKEDKDVQAWLTQLDAAPHFMTRMNAFQASATLDSVFGANYSDRLLSLLRSKDEFWATKQAAMSQVPFLSELDTAQALTTLLEVFRGSQQTRLRADALSTIDSLSRGDDAVTDVFIGAMRDSSMRVVRTALSVLTDRDPCSAIELSEQLTEEDSDEMFLWISRMHAMCGDAASLKFFRDNDLTLTGIDRFMFNSDFTRFAKNAADEEVYDALVEHLGGSAFEEMTWWARMSTVQGLTSALNFYSAAIEGLEEVESPDQETLTHLARLRNKKANLSALIDEAKEVQEAEDEEIIR